MRIECQYDEATQSRIDDIKRRLIDREKYYLGRFIDARSDIEVMAIKLQHMNDHILESLNQALMTTINYSVPKYILIPETDEEKRELARRYADDLLKC